MTILLQLARQCVEAAERIEDEERSIQSAQLLVAARVFAGACEVFAEWRKVNAK